MHVLAAGLPTWGVPLLRPCDLLAVLTAARAHGSRRTALALSLHAPLLALQASPAALAAARLLAAAYVGASAPLQAQRASQQAAPAPGDALDGTSQRAPTVVAGTGRGHAGMASSTGAAEGAATGGGGGAGGGVSGAAALADDDLRSGLFTLATSPSSRIGASV